MRFNPLALSSFSLLLLASCQLSPAKSLSLEGVLSFKKEEILSMEYHPDLSTAISVILTSEEQEKALLSLNGDYSLSVTDLAYPAYDYCLGVKGKNETSRLFHHIPLTHEEWIVSFGETTYVAYAASSLPKTTFTSEG
jgi:hypothetical protein